MKVIYSSDRYSRRAKLSARGYRLPPVGPRISRGFNVEGSNRVPVLCFDSQADVEKYCRHLRVAGRGENLWENYGYYADADGMETIKPAVAFIGKTALYGYEESGGMFCFYIESGQHGCTSEQDFLDYLGDLASWADTKADRAAENEREFHEQWHKAREIESKVEELENERSGLYETARGWIGDLRGSTASPSLCSRLRGMLADIRAKASSMAEQIAEMKAELKTLPE